MLLIYRPENVGLNSDSDEIESFKKETGWLQRHKQDKFFSCLNGMENDLKVNKANTF